MGRVGGVPVSQFTLDVLELAVKQGRAVTNSTMLSSTERSFRF
uniref:Uncharacterized protein n=1 Tax=Siphoviridae sp. ctXOZ1 TaxID=2823585 RepID=A0A8S5LBB2_9CAUD|nr:MAG TPA: hypothetical protein [Siphoviridae sp. ctXOZ1]